jgi:phosphate transport system substrate-binding protein
MRKQLTIRLRRAMSGLMIAGAVAASGLVASAQTIHMIGGGSTFGNPIYTRWFTDYNRLHPDVQISYNSIGSGAGIQQFLAGTVFFGATDGPMSDAQLKSAPGPVLHFPTVLGGVVPIYNVPGVTAALKFTGPVLADIYLGKITKWNDPAIASLNPGVKLPNAGILVVHRADGSGTTYIWADYLSKVSPEWKEKVGVSTGLKWPVGLGGKGSEGVAGLVRQSPASLGYVELTYALQNHIAYGSVKNKTGHFVTATLESVTAAAAAAAKTMPADFRVSITDAPGEDAYPISSYTWIVMWQRPKDVQQGRTLVAFFEWALTEGQKKCGALGYAPLPQNVVQMELKALQTIQLS